MKIIERTPEEVALHAQRRTDTTALYLRLIQLDDELVKSVELDEYEWGLMTALNDFRHFMRVGASHFGWWRGIEVIWRDRPT